MGRLYENAKKNASDEKACSAQEELRTPKLMA